jgi:hypothetical protein
MKRLVSSVWKAVLCAVALMAGTMVGALVAAAAKAALPAIPPGGDDGSRAVFGFLASLSVAFALGLLAAGLAVGLVARGLTLALLAYVCLGPNTAIEAAIFTTMGGTSAMLILNVFSSLFLAAALAALFRPSAEPAAWRACWRSFWAERDGASWAWRLGTAVLAFPLLYLTFGMMVGPFVVESYRGREFGLVLPSLGLVFAVQLVRSLLFLAASLPVLVAWRGSRLALGLALGLAHFALVGLFGLLQAYWLPGPMRLLHGGEILADSMTYAAVVVALLVRPPAGHRAPRSLTPAIA